MYGGLILDLYDIILQKFAKTPYQIYGPAVVKDYVYFDLLKTPCLNIFQGFT